MLSSWARTATVLDIEVIYKYTNRHSANTTDVIQEARLCRVSQLLR